MLVLVTVPKITMMTGSDVDRNGWAGGNEGCTAEVEVVVAGERSVFGVLKGETASWSVCRLNLFASGAMRKVQLACVE